MNGLLRSDHMYEAKSHIYFFCFLLSIFSCNKPDSKREINALFTLLDASVTNVSFANHLEFSQDFNIYTYRNYYNGGGVALGDINNDGLTDIYFTANMGDNKLYLNKGNFKFEDITESAGVKGNRKWSTGVSLADIDGDGFLDLYVCNSGDIAGDNRQNELFINNGDLTFTERAGEYHIADEGLSTHGVFFDYDNDGDLDLYLLNNSYKAIGSFNLQKNERTKRDPKGGDKLYRNEKGKYVDVSEQAGIYGSVIGFGLGVTVGDVNKDGWMDIYVSNDFFEKDYLYLNNGDGTFNENLEKQIKSISSASMGADMADINNDTYPDIFVTDMLPEQDGRLKTKTTFENWDRYQYHLKNDYYHQFNRNMLHLNNGNGSFSEIGRLAGVAATDWSWGALIADLNNDGFKDIFVANGIYQDLTDQDFLNFIANDQTKREIISEEGVDFKKLVAYIPSSVISNYVFSNVDGVNFTNETVAWGLNQPGNSNGAAYGDLDNDGDLDLVVNNVNMTSFIYRNESEKLFPDNHYLSIELVGKGKNTSAIGSKVEINVGDQSYYLEQMPARGFQSSVDSRLHFGLGNHEFIDTLKITWPNGQYSVETDIRTNQSLRRYQKNADDHQTIDNNLPKRLFTDVTGQFPAYVHIENEFVDFDRDRLMYHMLSSEGPKICVADVDGNGLEDLFIGGAKDSPGILFIQLPDGNFKKKEIPDFENDKLSEDTDCLFFDADGDNDPDLYVASGGNEFPNSSSALIDRLYINDSHGNFKRSDQVLPASNYENTSCIKGADYDLDGDIDLFVGIRSRPFLYGVPVSSYLLENNGKGEFENVTRQIAPALINIGMVTDASWSDIDADEDPDLVIVGEWMPIRIFENNNGFFRELSDKTGLEKSNGWWKDIASGDFDNDGDLDFVVGNHGLNSRFKASGDKPISLTINDFDKNGSAEQILCMYNGTRSYPFVLKHDLVTQIPSLKKKYLKYEYFKDQTINDIFAPEQLEKAVKQIAYLLESSLIINNGNGKFSISSLPVEAQLSPVYAIYVQDFDNDGNEDILLGGNFYRAKPEVGRYDASYGTYLKGDGSGNFKYIETKKSGLKLDGEVRDIQPIKVGSQTLILIAKNNDTIQVLSY